MTKKAYIKTWGCQMNVYDSTRMQEALESDGYTFTNKLEQADLVLLNTCHIREKAAEKVYSGLGKLRHLKQTHNKNLMIGVAGCVAQAEGAEIIARESVVDMVIGPQSYHNLPKIIAKAKQGKKQVATNFEVDEKFKQALPNKQQIQKQGVAAFLTVQEGCDKFCTFCVVPYTRGAEVSRPLPEIVKQATVLVAGGVKEITLLGQNVNAWHGQDGRGKKIGLGELLRALAEIKGLARLRYVTSHPSDMNDELIEAHKDLPCLMPYLHLPVQSGCDKILKAMNRRHTVKTYIEIIEKVRAARADIAISGDFIVGFPGETDADFQQTLDLVREINYAQSFSFKYSMRPGTPGANMENQIEEHVKKQRLAELQDLLSGQQKLFNESCVGKTFDILLEKQGKHAGQLIGRSPYLQSVILENVKHKIGDIVSVKIKQAGRSSLLAEQQNLMQGENI